MNDNEKALQNCTDPRGGCCCVVNEKCAALEDTHFDDCYCPFYKSSETMREELKKIAIRFIRQDDFRNAKATVERLAKIK